VGVTPETCREKN